MVWQRLEPGEVLYIGRHAAAVCFEAVYGGASLWAHDWDVLACAVFQTLSYFCEGVMFFRDWQKLAGLSPQSHQTLLALMKSRGWRTQSPAVPNPWCTFS
jgi:hypothetical protein